jgi:hypothetical protein
MEEEFQLYYLPECNTDKAICVCEDTPDHVYNDDKRFFLPLSQIEVLKKDKVIFMEKGVKIETKVITFLCPEWLAQQKGLI